MGYLSDIEIAQGCRMKPIQEIAKKAHVAEKYVEPYGWYKAKIDPALLNETDRKPGKLILVTAITPGECTVTATCAGGYEDRCRITVRQ